EFGGGQAGNGAIFQPLFSGPGYWLHGEIWRRYGLYGGVSSGLGWPTGDQSRTTSPQGTTGEYAGFEGGQILWPISGPGGTGQAYAVWGRILTLHRQFGGVTGGYGYAQSDAVPNGQGGYTQRFEGGVLSG